MRLRGTDRVVIGYQTGQNWCVYLISKNFEIQGKNVQIGFEHTGGSFVQNRKTFSLPERREIDNTAVVGLRHFDFRPI